MRISLNLATRPFADLGPAIKRLRIAMGALALISIGLGIGLHLVHDKAERARARDHSLDGQIAAITRERQSYTDLMHQPANAEVLKESQALNQLFDQKTFSWTLAMEDLETVLPGGVQVASLEPVLDKEGKITLHLRVNGPRDREVALVRNLEHSRRFLLPRIVGENAESKEGPNEQLQPVSASNRFNFDLLAEYNPSTVGELTEEEKHVAATEKAEQKSARPKSAVIAGRIGGVQAPGARPQARVPRPGQAIIPGRVMKPLPGRPRPNTGGPQ